MVIVSSKRKHKLSQAIAFVAADLRSLAEVISINPDYRSSPEKRIEDLLRIAESVEKIVVAVDAL